MAVVTKTIGTAGRQYSTISSWLSDTYGSATSLDDAVGEVYNDTVFDERLFVSDSTPASVTITVPESERHDGTAGTGARIVYTGSSNNSVDFRIPNYLLEWLEFERQTGTDYQGFWTNNPDAVGETRYCLFHGMSPDNPPTDCFGFHMLTSAGLDGTVIHNCIIYDCKMGALPSNDDIWMFRSQTQSGSLEVYNCTIHDIGAANTSGTIRGFILSDESRNALKNNLVTDVTNDGSGAAQCFYNVMGSVTANNNASSDATAPGTSSLTNITSDQYVSSDPGLEDLHLKSGSDAIGAGADLGTTPVGVNLDIDGTDRTGKTWDIGADQYAAATVVKSIGTAGRDYSTITAWHADSYGASPGDDAIGECYNDSIIDEGAQVLISDSTVESPLLTSPESERHDGTAGSGTHVRWPSGGGISLNRGIVEWLEFDGYDNSSNVVNATGAGTTVQCRNLIIHGVAANSFGDVSGLSTTGSSGPKHYFQNIILYDIKHVAPTYVNASITGFFDGTGSGSTIFAANLTVHDVSHAGTEPGQSCVGAKASNIGANKNFQNIISTDVVGGGGTTGCFSISGNVNNNMSSDATAPGTGSITNVVTADQFVSIDPGLEDLHLKEGSDAIGAGADLGTTPEGVNIDIDGQDRTTFPSWDIGADQFVATIWKRSIGTAGRDYSTISAWVVDGFGQASAGQDSIGECYNDSVFTGGATITGGTGLTATRITVPESERHDGTAGTGARIVNSVTSWHFDISPISGVEREVSWLEMDSDNGATRGVTSSGFFDAENLFDHNIFHNFDAFSNVFSFAACTNYSKLSNNIFYDLNNQSYGSCATISGQGAVCLQNTFFDVSAVSDPGNDFNVIVTFSPSPTQNTIVVGSKDAGTGSFKDFATWGNADHNISGDASATGTGSIPNAVAADQFISVDPGLEDLHLKEGSDAIGTGQDLGTSTPKRINLDIDGQDRTTFPAWDIGADQFVSSTTTTTIGTAGRDYSTITAWHADSYGATAGNDAIGECYNDSVFNEAAVLTDATPDSVTLTVPEAERHDGTAGTGVTLNTGNAADIGFYYLAAIPCVVEWISVTEMRRQGIFEAAGTLSVRNVVINKIGQDTNSISGVSSATIVSNSIIYDIKSTNNEAIGLKRSAGSVLDWSNNTVFDVSGTVGYGFQSTNNSAIKLRNLIGCQSQTLDFRYGVGSIQNNNISSDATATGTGSITNVVTADQFVSIDEGLEDLHLKSGSDAIGAGADLGTTPVGVNIDIDGEDRTTFPSWDIGADQFVSSTTTTTIGTAGRDYSTITAWHADSYGASAGDDAIGECYNDTVFESESFPITLSDKTPATILLTSPEGERHDGTAGTGVKVTTSGNVTYGLDIFTGGILPTTAEWLEFDFQGFSATYGIHAGDGCTIGNCIVHNNELIGNALGHGISRRNWSGRSEPGIFVNNIVYDMRLRAAAAGVGGAYGIDTIDREANAYNNTVYKMGNLSTVNGRDPIGINIEDASGYEFRNNISVGHYNDNPGGTTLDFGVSNPTSAVADHNMSSDATATGTGSIPNVVTADQFVSIDEGLEDLHLKSGSDAIGAGADLGTTPVGVNIDIDGEDRTTFPSWDIGADQFVGLPQTSSAIVKLKSTSGDYQPFL